MLEICVITHGGSGKVKDIKFYKNANEAKCEDQRSFYFIEKQINNVQGREGFTRRGQKLKIFL